METQLAVVVVECLGGVAWKMQIELKKRFRMDREGTNGRKGHAVENVVFRSAAGRQDHRLGADPGHGGLELGYAYGHGFVACVEKSAMRRKMGTKNRILWKNVKKTRIGGNGT